MAPTLREGVDLAHGDAIEIALLEGGQPVEVVAFGRNKKGDLPALGLKKQGKPVYDAEFVAAVERVRAVLECCGDRDNLHRPRSGSVGAPVRGSVPDWVFGKAMISRMFSSPARRAARRSMPKAKPAWGGAP